MNGLIMMQDGRLVDLAADVTPALFAELEKPSPRRSPAAYCLKCGGGLYFRPGRVNPARLFGCHHPGASCDARHIAEVNRVSDEHKRQVEAVGIAAVRAGETFATEVPTTGRTRLDGLIGGRIGFEAQRSHLTSGAAVDRTRRSVAAAGLGMVLWGSDWGTDPAWIGRVPGWRYAGHFTWQAVPDPADVGVLGVQDVEMERIGSGWRPRPVPHPVTIQDIIEGTADGSIIPAAIARKVRLVTRRGDALWRGHTGQDTTWMPAAPPLPLNGSGYTAGSECDRPVVSLTPPRAEDPPEAPAARVPVLQFASAGVFCAWCHEALTGEQRRFKLVIHPGCADKRAAAYVAAGRPWSEIRPAVERAA